MALVAIDDPALPGLPADWRPTFLRLFLNLLTDREISRAALAQLAAMDPGFRPDRWRSLPRVLLHLPWPPARYDALLAPLWPDELPPPSPVCRAAPPLDIDCHACAPPRDVPARALLNRQSLWPDPWLARHARETMALLDRSTTADSHVALSIARAHGFDLVAARNQLLHAPLFAPLESLLTGAPGDPQGSAQAVTHLNLAQILSLPRMQLYFRHWLNPLPEGFGAFQGEVGWRLRQLALDHPDPHSVIPFPQGSR